MHHRDCVARSHVRSYHYAYFCLFSALLIAVCHAETAQQPVTDLTHLSLEALLNIEVTSASKKPQSLSDTTAALFVITQEDMRRSGVTSIPDALRMVPGLQVARIDANKWAVSSRGFNSRLANKLLVLVDGRSIYTQLFSGVYWEVQDPLLEDIERIEVIRGPGATLWGANAVNGVINIITRQARDTQGALVSAGGGTEERGFGGVRYGMKVGEDAHARLYAKYFYRDGFVDAFGKDSHDDWQLFRAGGRMDWQPDKRDMLTMQGDIYSGEAYQDLRFPALAAPYLQSMRDDIGLFGGNLLGRWQRTFSSSSGLALQVYYDRLERDEIFFNEKRDTVDVDFQHHFSLGKRQAILWGAGYRFVHDDLGKSSLSAFIPSSRTNHLLNIFVQDDITLLPERLYLTLGTKLEHNDYTGFEVQPNGRLLWTPHAQHSVWAAVSRAVRTPSRGDNDLQAIFGVIPPSPSSGNPAGLASVITATGNRHLPAETLLAFELGYRLQPLTSLSVDLATFYQRYDDLRTLEPPGSPMVDFSPPPPRIVLANTLDAKAHGESWGVELAVDWRPVDWWRVQTAYTYLQLRLYLDRDSQATSVEDSVENRSPRHQVSLRSALDLPWHFAFDTWVRYVTELPRHQVESYVTFDVRLGWRPSQRFEAAIVGQNLLEQRHPEFVQEFFGIPTEVQRSVYGKILWRF